MTLAELEATLIRYEERDGSTYLPLATSLADAHGVMFLCPKCFAENRGPVGTHSIICWFAGRVPAHATPGPGRWNPRGSGLEDLTFVPPGSTSVLLTSGCRWHGYVENGRCREA